MTQNLDCLGHAVPAVDPDPARSALVIIDMQYHDAWPNRGLTAAIERKVPGSMAYYSARLSGTTIPAIEHLLKAWRTAELPVIHLVFGSNYRDLRDCPSRIRDWMRNMEKISGLCDVFWSGSEDFGIIAPLAPVPGEMVVKKTTNGAFNGSNLDDLLRRTGLDTLVICGVVTSACVETTARDAADRGYGCVLVSDACADYDPDMHEATMKAFALNFGRVVLGPDDILDLLPPQLVTP